MFFGKKRTKIDLTACTMTAIRHIQQALEVLFGELVEFQHLSFEFGPVHDPVPKFDRDVDHRPCLVREVEFENGKFVLYPSGQKFDLSGFFTMRKLEIFTYGVLYIEQGSDVFHTYEMWWKYLPGKYPEVVVHQGDDGVAWVGCDRTERREEPIFP